MVSSVHADKGGITKKNDGRKRQTAHTIAAPMYLRRMMDDQAYRMPHSWTQKGVERREKEARKEQESHKS